MKSAHAHVPVAAEAAIEPLFSPKETMRIVRKSRSQLYRDIKAGTFPRPIRIGKRRTMFVPAEIRSWISSQPRASTRGDVYDADR